MSLLPHRSLRSAYCSLWHMAEHAREASRHRIVDVVVKLPATIVCCDMFDVWHALVLHSFLCCTG